MLLADNAQLIERLMDCEAIPVTEFSENEDVQEMLKRGMLREKNGVIYLGYSTEKYFRLNKYDKHYKIFDTPFPYEGQGEGMA